MLRKIFAFDHCVRNVNDAAWIATSGYVVSRYNASTGKPLIIDSNGALTSTTGTSTSAATIAGISFDQFLVPNPTKIVIGFRHKTLVAGATGNFVALGPDIGFSTAGWVLDYSLLPTAAKAVGAEIYLEFEIDFTANTLAISGDGLLLSSVALTAVSTAAYIATMKTGKISLFFSLTLSGGTNLCSIRDMYILDNIAGDGIVARLGSVSTYPVYADEATATPTAWAGSDGTTNMLTTLTAAQPATATVDSPTDKSPLKLSLKANTPEGFKINAVQLMASVIAKGNNATLAKIEVTQGGTTVQAGNLTVPKTQAYGSTIATLPTAPAGGAWDASKIDGTVITITPDVTG